MSLHSSSRRSALGLALFLTISLGPFGPDASAQTPSTTAAPRTGVSIPESITVQNIPPLSRDLAEALDPYDNLRSAFLTDWHPTERRLLISTMFGETSQLHEVALPMGARTQITFRDERVTGGDYRPGNPSHVLYGMDEGGAENYQFFLLDRTTGRSRRLTDGVHRHQGGLWSPDGDLFAYTSNARNGRDFDVYVMDPDRPDTPRRLTDLEGRWYIQEWSPKGDKLLLLQYLSVTDSSLHSLELETGQLQRLTPAPPEGRTTYWDDGIFAHDGRSIFAVTDAQGEFRRLVRLDVASGEAKVLSGFVDWDVDSVALSDDGEMLAFLTNEDGFSKLHLLNLVTDERLPGPSLPPGVASGLEFRPGDHEVGFQLSWAQGPWDVYSYRADTRRTTRWTASEVGGLDTSRFPVPELVRFESFDGLSVPAFVYRPDTDRFPGPRPVYINIHGGPEAQSLPLFLGSTNYLPVELGVAVVVPNVRGSAGYGKSYIKMDNGDKREDSVRDIGALLDWIGTQSDLDASRVMVGGASYGGYMALASLVHYSDRLRAGFDYVGISHFVTFLENTQDYRRDLRRVEYGDERDPEMRRHLEAISPANQAARIRRPLLVAQGANDPRVPLSEADQIVAALSDADIPVWYLVAADEGHGFRKRGNADFLRVAWIQFVETYLVDAPKAPPEVTDIEVQVEEGS